MTALLVASRATLLLRGGLGMRFADQRTRYALCRKRLTQRRNVVVQTLAFLNDQRNKLKTGRPWKIPPAQRRRLNFLDEIHAWYDTELRKINAVLESQDESLYDRDNRRANFRSVRPSQIHFGYTSRRFPVSGFPISDTTDGTSLQICK
jgi:hypothetical protein